MNELRDAMLEVERELLVRQRVYPRLVEQGKLTQGEADRRTRSLRQALYFLESATGIDGPMRTPTTSK